VRAKGSLRLSVSFGINQPFRQGDSVLCGQLGQQTVELFEVPQRPMKVRIGVARAAIGTIRQRMQNIAD
jgi:hypothetical protein